MFPVLHGKTLFISVTPSEHETEGLWGQVKLLLIVHPPKAPAQGLVDVFEWMSLGSVIRRQILLLSLFPASIFLSP